MWQMLCIGCCMWRWSLLFHTRTYLGLTSCISPKPLGYTVDTVHQYGTCDSGTSCGTSNCLASYSTGCRNTGSMIAEHGAPNKQIIVQRNSLNSSMPESSNIGEQLPGEVSSSSSAIPSLNYLAQLPRPHLGSTPYGQVITSCTVPGTLALSFNDGPWLYTSDLLDLLQREDVHATFFVCGGNMAEDQLTGYGHPQLLRRMVTSGHQIGTHTWAHPNLAGISQSEVFRQMYLNEQALVGALGILPTYFRPPYLRWTAETLDIMEELGYHIITLDVDTRDWEGDYDAAEQKFLGALGWGSDSKLVLAHDIHERTVYEFAEWMIDTAKERGYRLVTVGECLGDSVDNWYRSPYTGESWQTGDSRPRTHERRAAYPDESNMPSNLARGGPRAPEYHRQPQTSNSTRTMVVGMLVVFLAVFMFT